MVAQDHCVITHVFRHAGIDMRRYCVHIIEIVGSIVPLKDVSGIQQDDVFSPRCRTDAVHHAFHGVEGFLYIPPDVGGIEIGSVNVIGGE